MKDRYYVQCLTTQIYLIRECISADGKPGPGDRLIRAFDIRHDAELYANNENVKQRILNEASELRK